MGNLDIHSLTEQHQFIILLIVEVAQIVSMILLYRSHPKGKPPDDGSTPAVTNDPGPHS